MFDKKTTDALIKRAKTATEGNQLVGTLVSTQSGTALVFPAIGDLDRIEVPVSAPQVGEKVKPDGDKR